MLAHTHPTLKNFQKPGRGRRVSLATPIKIAELILRAFTDVRPRFRYAGPKHAHLFSRNEAVLTGKIV